MVDRCIYCNLPVLWEESEVLPGELLAHPECATGVRAARRRGIEATDRLAQLKDGKELDDLLQ